VVPTFVYRAAKGLPLQVDNGGAASRDFIFVADIVEGLIRCALAGEAGDVYNLASGRETTILELAETVNQLTGNGAPIDFQPQRSWDRAGRRVGSTRKAQQVLSFEAATTLEAGLANTISWTRANLDLIDRTIAKHSGHLQIA